MFPIRDHNPSERTPFVTYGLIVLNILIFISYFGDLGDGARVAAIFDAFALMPARFTAGVQYETLVTSMFLHAGLLHLGGNMLFLWIFGDNLEDVLGHLGFLAFYLASGAAAGLAQVWSAPDATVPMVGASGAIAGVMGGYLLLFPKARVDVLIILIFIVRIIVLPAWMMLLFWFGLQLISGYVSLGVNSGGVAYVAHAGGFIAGLALAVPVFLSLGGPVFWSSTAGAPAHPETRVRARPTTIPRVRRRR